ncbi:hypothetical protein RFI_39174, partial [Reticulomyxa filosa]
DKFKKLKSILKNKSLIQIVLKASTLQTKAKKTTLLYQLYKRHIIYMYTLKKILMSVFLMCVNGDHESMLLLREKQFDKKENEMIDNKYDVGDWLEVRDLRRGRWIICNVIDKENN